MDIRDYRPTGPVFDLTGPPTSMCICGCNLFRTVVSFDEEFEIATYALDGECLECGTRLTLVTPLDKE